MKRLFASIHDVSPRFELQVDSLYDRLSGLLGSPRMAMLVVPDFEDGAPLSANPTHLSFFLSSPTGGIVICSESSTSVTVTVDLTSGPVTDEEHSTLVSGAACAL